MTVLVNQKTRIVAASRRACSRIPFTGTVLPDRRPRPRTSPATSSSSADRPPAEPRVVAALEPLEDVDEQLEAVALDPARTGPGVPPTLIPIPSDHALARLGEDPRHLAPVDQHVVRVLDRRRRARSRRRRRGAATSVSSGHARPAAADRAHREHQGRVDPGAPEPAAALASGARPARPRRARRPPAASAASSASRRRSGTPGRMRRAAREGPRRRVRSQAAPH